MTAPRPVHIALALAEHGLKVFPVSRDKRPRCPRGHLAASSDAKIIEALHVHYGFVLIGIATGEPSSRAVLDIDIKDEARAWWAANRQKLPTTRVHRTRGGGLHLWFRHRPGLRSNAGRVAQGVDIRADRASAIWWPAAGLPVLCDAEPAPWPEWLIPPDKPRWTPALSEPWHGTDSKARRYAEGALRRAIQRVAGAASGTRNGTLNAETYALARFAAIGALDHREIALAMAHAGTAAGLERREIEATLRSALSAGGVPR